MTFAVDSIDDVHGRVRITGIARSCAAAYPKRPGTRPFRIVSRMTRKHHGNADMLQEYLDSRPGEVNDPLQIHTAWLTVDEITPRKKAK